MGPGAPPPHFVHRLSLTRGLHSSIMPRVRRKLAKAPHNRVRPPNTSRCYVSECLGTYLLETISPIPFLPRDALLPMTSYVQCSMFDPCWSDSVRHGEDHRERDNSKKAFLRDRLSRESFPIFQPYGTKNSDHASLLLCGFVGFDDSTPMPDSFRAINCETSAL